MFFFVFCIISLVLCQSCLMIFYWLPSLIRVMFWDCTPHVLLFALGSPQMRHADLRGSPVTAHQAWHCSMVTTLIVNIWAVLAILSFCVVICHNMSEGISISWTSLGKGGGGYSTVIIRSSCEKNGYWKQFT